MSPYHSGVGRIEQYDGVVYVVTEGEAGCVIFGPYCSLAPGSYEVEFYVIPQEMNNLTCCVVDVLRRGVAIVAEKDHTAAELLNRNGVIRLRFEVQASDTYEFRVTATGSSPLRVRYQRPCRLVDALPA